MALTQRGRRLTEAHRRRQSAIAARAVALILATTDLLDADEIDGSFVRWLGVIGPVVATERNRSSRAAASYYRRFRLEELITSVEFTPALADPLPSEALSKSMATHTVARVRRAEAAGLDPRSALDLGRKEATREAARHVTDAGRGTLMRAVAEDPVCLGHARAASSSCCAFCAMLAGRGPVYSERSARFQAHASCRCQPEPVYDQSTNWPGDADRYAAQWAEATRGLSGPDAIRAFRQAHEGREITVGTSDG